MANLSHKCDQVLKVAIPVPVRKLFDYLPPEGVEPENLKPGIRIKVPFGKSFKIGILTAISPHSAINREKLKQAFEILDDKPLLFESDMKLLHWAQQYYHHPPGEVFCSAFPVELRKGKKAQTNCVPYYLLTNDGFKLDSNELKRAPKQKALLEKLQNNTNGLCETELNGQLDNWRRAFKELKSRGLACIEERTKEPAKIIENQTGKGPELNDAQRQAVESVVEKIDHFSVFLLAGVTGSGKTEVYMNIINSVLLRGLQVLVLLPEITLTPQLEERFRARFSARITISHSKLSNHQRLDSWLKMQNGTASIMLGTRSALFTPLNKPGLIILDEEHDASFKQQEGFKFSARDVAIVRGKILNVPVILGTATPSLETYCNTLNGRYHLVELPNRAGDAKLPKVHLLDIRNKTMREGFSENLLDEMRKTLDKDEQVLIFLNRRGFAPTLICHCCGWVARCRRCEANLVVHRGQRLLRCHHCGGEQHLPNDCPNCKSTQLVSLGLGTERVEAALSDLFPTKSVIRLDRDSTQRKGSLEKYLEKIQQGEVDILLGTQMLAKGHHFPNVTLVVLLDVDSGLFSIDFRSPENLAQLVVQVSGRSGRAGKAGRVIIQTRHPDHPLWDLIINQGYNRFMQMELAERKATGLPPYSYQSILRVEATNNKSPIAFIDDILKRAPGSEKVQTYGPVSAPLTKKAGRYRYQLLIQSINRSSLHHYLDELLEAIEATKLVTRIRWSLDVDPVDLY